MIRIKVKYEGLHKKETWLPIGTWEITKRTRDDVFYALDKMVDIERRKRKIAIRYRILEEEEV